MKTICLNMIVKNESKVIERCLASVIPLIDSWVIVDTGSTDGTQEIIRNYLKKIPGKLHKRPWTDFEKNRNTAMALARGKADYLLFIDADETLEFEKAPNKESLNKNYYLVKSRDLSVDFYRILLIDQNPLWRWKGVLYETLIPPDSASGEILPDLLRVGLPRDGARAKDTTRYLKDASILEASLKKEPSNSRTVFYLAQSYGAAGELALSLENYRKRTEMGGLADEVFLSQYYCGCLEEDLKKRAEEILCSYEKAYRLDPTRAEPLATMAKYFLKSNAPLLAYLLAKFGLTHPVPKTLMYVRREVYDYQLLFLLACATQSLGKKAEALSCYKQLLSNKELPDETRQTIERNLLL
jgi:glycosyltransferase involved in cell wall biosynthesis